MARINSVSILQTSEIMGVVFFLLGAVVSCFGVMFVMILTTESLVLNLVALMALPLLTGFAGFAGSALFCWLFNQIAAWMGGIPVEIEEDSFETWYPASATGPES